jgi:fructoselysine 6-kinase
VHTALWGKAEKALPKIAEKGVPIAFDYADRLDHPLVEETLPYVTYGFYSYHKGKDEFIKAFLKDKVDRGMKIAVATFGDKGSLAYDAAGYHIGPIYLARKVVNTVGAGDAYIAGFLYSIMSGDDVLRAMRTGARVASRVVEVFEPWETE